MEPIEAMLALAPIAREVADLLFILAAPNLHAELPKALPPGTTTAKLGDLFRRFAEAARTFDQNRGQIDGSEAYVRAARTLARFSGSAQHWDPRSDAPPEAVVALARMALAHLGTKMSADAWDSFERTAAGDASP